MDWDENQTFPLEAVKKLGKLGYLGAIFPEEYGGAGLGYVEYSIIIEELSRVDGSVGIIVAAHTSLCSNHIYKAGSEAQKQKYLTKLTSGEWIGCWSLTEPEAGSDAAGTRTTARRRGWEGGVGRAKRVDHQCALRRRLCRNGNDGSHGCPAWNFGLHPGERDTGISRGQEGEQAWFAR